MTASGRKERRSPRPPRDPAWWRAPLWSIRSPGSALAVVLAVAVAAMVAGAAPLFLALLGDEVFNRQLDDLSDAERGVTVTVLDALPDAARLADVTAILVDELGPEGVFAPASLTVVTRTGWVEGRMYRVDAGDPSQLDRIRTAGGSEWTEGGRDGIRLVARPGLLEAVDVVWSSGSSGLWVTDTVAEELSLSAGDELHLYLGTREPPSEDGGSGPRLVATVPIAGAYVDPWATDQLPPIWQGQPEWLVPRRPGRTERSSQQVLLADADTVAAIAETTGAALRASWVVPLADDELRLNDGLAVVDAMVALEERTAVAGSNLNDAVRGLHPDRRPPSVSSELPQAIAAARAGQDAVRPQIEGIAVSGVAIALGMVAAAGIFVTRRRATEVRLAWIEGTSPLALAGRSVLELLPPALVGALVGWGFALLLALPTQLRGAVELGWIVRTGLAAALAAAVGLVGLAVSVAVTARRLVRFEEDERAAGPVTALLVAAAATAASGIAVAGQPPNEPAGALVQAFPLLLAITVSLAGVLALARLLARAPLTARSVVVDLAVLRLRRSLRAATPLVVATALSGALLLYVGAVAASVGTITQDKAAVLAGAEAATVVDERYSELPSLPDGTEVVLRGNGIANPGRIGMVLLAVDASSLATSAPWGDRLDAAEVPEALAALDVELEEHVAVIAVGGDRQLGQEVLLDAPGALLRGRVVEERTAFPGLSLARPTYVVDRATWHRAVAAQVEEVEPASLEDDTQVRTEPDPTLLDGFRVELWASEATARRDAGATDGLTVRATRAVASELVQPRLLAQSISLRFLSLLGGVASLLAVAALILYVAARQRERHLAFVLSERMGLTAEQHRRAVALELLFLVLLASGLGLPAGVLGARAVLLALDPLPAVPPAVPVVVPGMLVLAIVAASVTLALLAAAIAQLQLRRASTSEVLRVAD